MSWIAIAGIVGLVIVVIAGGIGLAALWILAQEFNGH